MHIKRPACRSLTCRGHLSGDDACQNQDWETHRELCSRLCAVNEAEATELIPQGKLSPEEYSDRMVRRLHAYAIRMAKSISSYYVAERQDGHTRRFRAAARSRLRPVSHIYLAERAIPMLMISKERGEVRILPINALPKDRLLDLPQVQALQSCVVVLPRMQAVIP